MIRCKEGHFYDPTKHSACPWCSHPIDLQSTGAAKPARAAETRAQPLPGSTDTTRRLGSKDGRDPVVGWLVCLEGPDRGRDYRLKMEKNFIGRSTIMDIPVSGDTSVSREKHAVVTFDPKKQSFWVAPGESAGVVYLNGQIVHGATEMKAHDVLEIGRTKLTLIAFCGDRYRWE